MFADIFLIVLTRTSFNDNFLFKGSFSHFRLNQVDKNPLSRKRKRDSGINYSYILI